jgi:hypothetical protein
LTGQTTTQRVQTATAATFAIGDNYLVKQGLGPRFIANATVAAHPARFDSIYRMAGRGSTEPPVLPTREGAWLGLPKIEWSTMEPLLPRVPRLRLSETSSTF